MAWDDIPDWSADAANSILSTLKYKDPFTFHHCCRVGKLSRRLAAAMGLNEFEQGILEFAGLFHDVGKVGIPDHILLKPDRLNTEELAVMKSHAEISVDIIKPLTSTPFFRFLIPGIRYHHETVDGAGYPHKLQGDKIPISARIIAVVDSFDAMSNTRPYRQALPQEKVIQELKDFSGTQFDKAIVTVFLEALPFWELDTQTTDGQDIAITRLVTAA